MANHDDSDTRLKAAIDNRIRKDTHRKDATALCGQRAQARMLHQEICNALKLVKKPLGNPQA